MYKKLVPVLLAIAVMVMSSIACKDTGGIQDAGAQAVNSALLQRTNAEQAIIDTIQNNCRIDPVCASRQMP